MLPPHALDDVPLLSLEQVRELHLPHAQRHPRNRELPQKGSPPRPGLLPRVLLVLVLLLRLGRRRGRPEGDCEASHVDAKVRRGDGEEDGEERVRDEYAAVGPHHVPDPALLRPSTSAPGGAMRAMVCRLGVVKGVQCSLVLIALTEGEGDGCDKAQEAVQGRWDGHLGVAGLAADVGILGQRGSRLPGMAWGRVQCNNGGCDADTDQ
mmetsp:Transcript_40577/g.98662  ORF Transcript_40577/g.98662 Transcript_40577/m.98662 type:complete len:208 (-) Transcript_40577:74-697(-)